MRSFHANFSDLSRCQECGTFDKQKDQNRCRQCKLEWAQAIRLAFNIVEEKEENQMTFIDEKMEQILKDKKTCEAALRNQADYLIWLDTELPSFAMKLTIGELIKHAQATRDLLTEIVKRIEKIEKEAK